MNTREAKLNAVKLVLCDFGEKLSSAITQSVFRKENVPVKPIIDEFASRILNDIEQVEIEREYAT